MKEQMNIKPRKPIVCKKILITINTLRTKFEASSFICSWENLWWNI